MAVYRVAYMINGQGVTPPDSEEWGNIIVGTALTAREKRSHYRQLIWTKRLAEECDLDWFDFDNTTLTELVSRIPGSLRQSEVYTDAICQSVVMRHTRSTGVDVTAKFLVKVD